MQMMNIDERSIQETPEISGEKKQRGVSKLTSLDISLDLVNKLDKDFQLVNLAIENVDVVSSETPSNKGRNQPQRLSKQQIAELRNSMTDYMNVTLSGNREEGRQQSKVTSEKSNQEKKQSSNIMLNVGRLTMGPDSDAQDMQRFDQIENKSSQTSDLDTEINSSEEESMNFLGLPNPKPRKPVTIGKYLQVNENGWVEEKKILDLISPCEQKISSYLHEIKTTAPGKAQRNCRCKSKQNHSCSKSQNKKVEFGKAKTQAKKASSKIRLGNTQEVEAMNRFGIMPSSQQNNNEIVFRAQKAVQKLKKDKKPELAAYSLALDSQREMDRSQLVPMAPYYQNVTDYLTNQHQIKKTQATSTRQQRAILKSPAASKSFGDKRYGSLGLDGTDGSKQLESAATPIAIHRPVSMLNRPQSSVAGGTARQNFCKNRNLMHNRCSSTSQKTRATSAVKIRAGVISPVTQSEIEDTGFAFQSVATSRFQSTAGGRAGMLKQTTSKFQAEAKKLADLDQQRIKTNPDLKLQNRTVNVQKQAFFINTRGKFSHSALVNEEMPKNLEMSLAQTLIVKSVTFSKEEDVRRQCLKLWEKDLDKLGERMPAVVRYQPKEDGTFIKVDLQTQVDKAQRLLGRDFNKLTDDQKKIRMEEVYQREQQRKMQDRLAQDNPEDKVTEYKREVANLARNDERKQNTKSFSLINDLVQKELQKQSELEEEQQQAQLHTKIAKEQRERKKAQTSKTIFENETNKENGMTVDRNASDKQRKEYKVHFMNLQIFLQFYKEKLMLTKKVQDSLSKHVVTMDALKKAKDGYTDQFQLDFEQLFKVFLVEQDKKAKGEKTFVPEGKPKPPKLDKAKRMRQRMVSYGRKVANRVPLDFGLEKPDLKVIDYDDIKNRDCNEVSAYGKLVSYKQGQVMDEAKGIKEYLDKCFKEMKHVRELSKRELREQQEKEIEEALIQIKNKYFASALKKKGPNMQIQNVFDLTAQQSKRNRGLQRQNSALSARSGYSAQPKVNLERQLTGAGQQNIQSAMRNLNIGHIVSHTSTAKANHPGVKFLDPNTNSIEKSGSEKSYTSARSAASNKESARMLDAFDNVEPQIFRQLKMQDTMKQSNKQKKKKQSLTSIKKPSLVVRRSSTQALSSHDC